MLPPFTEFESKLTGRTRKEKMGIIFTWIKQGVIDLKLFRELMDSLK